MHDYLYDVSTVRVAIILGVVVTTLFYERTQLTTGGAIVPGYLSLFLVRPLYIVTTLVTSYLTYYVVNKLIAKRYILYGRRKFEIEILTTLALLALWFGAAHLVLRFSPRFSALYGIGFVIPAVIAHDAFRQGPGKTYLAILINVAIIGMVIYVFSSLHRISPWYDGEVVTGLGAGPFGYDTVLLLPAVVISVLAGMVVFRQLGLRTGGFVAGAYLALVALRPVDLLFVAAVSIGAYLFVTRFLMHHMLIFGRRKLGMMILVASILAWSGEFLLVTVTHERYIPWQGFHAITLMVPALLANDAQRQGIYRTLWGAGITAAAVFTAMNFLEAGLVSLGYR